MSIASESKSQTASEILKGRRRVYENAKESNPERWAGTREQTLPAQGGGRDQVGVDSAVDALTDAISSIGRSAPG